MTTAVMVVGTVVPITVWFPLAYNYSIPDTSSHLILTTTWGQTFIPPSYKRGTCDPMASKAKPTASQ